MTSRRSDKDVLDAQWALAKMYEAYRLDWRFDAIRPNSDIVPGDGALWPKLIFVGEAPGKTEALQGRPFIGRAGQFLDELITEHLGLNRSDVYITNLVKYWPGQGNPDPSPEEMEAGLEYLRHEIKLVAGDCRLIVSLGRLAGGAIQLSGNGNILPMGQCHGKVIRLKGGFELCPMYHPSWGLRGNTNREVMRRDFDRLRGLIEG